MNARNANQVGKYLYDHIDSANKCVRLSNTCRVYMFVWYQLPWEKRTVGDLIENPDMYEMNIVIDITHYADKLRFNIIEISPMEKTLGHFVIEDGVDLKELPKIVLNKIKKLLNKEYAKYIFVY